MRRPDAGNFAATPGVPGLRGQPTVAANVGTWLPPLTRQIGFEHGLWSNLLQITSRHSSALPKYISEVKWALVSTKEEEKEEEEEEEEDEEEE